MSDATAASDRYLQVWRAPGGKTHLCIATWPRLRAACRPWRRTWQRVGDDAPVTCGACRRSAWVRPLDADLAEAGRG